ncbi:MAG: hypothetical protein M1820_003750 [Bogoriella megaspora]|nr:MAG: hypothetical protein M1820_003750 [Bogoriella megaspora]
MDDNDLLIRTLRNIDYEEVSRETKDSLTEFQHRVETPFDTLQRFAGLHLQIAMARVGIDLHIFEMINNNSPDLVTVGEIAEKNGASPELIARILRYLTSVGIIEQRDDDAFGATKMTAVFANKAYQGGIYHFFDTVGPILQQLPEFLAETKYQDITDPTKTPLQRAFDTELPGFIWFQNQPERFGHFQRVMTVQRAGAPTWLEVFPFEQELGDWHDKPVFVDVGGGFGHQCQALKEAFPDLPGKIILEDLPQTLEHIPAIKGVEAVAQNFFEPQVIQGAKFYYLRNILHDWPDEKCIAILKNLIPAMGQESRILIDEMVVPAVGAHWQATQLDLTMMAALGSKERTKEQWYALLEAAGLKIERILPYTEPFKDSVIIAVPK